MSDQTPSSNRTVQTTCHACLLYVKLALAGDMESVLLVDQLIELFGGIEWENPTFIARSEEMRGTAPLMPYNTADVPIWRAMVHALTEQLAARDETIAEMSGSLRSAGATLYTGSALFRQRTEYMRKQAIYAAELMEFARKLIVTATAMKDHIELLDADTSQYIFPELPTRPQV